MKNSRAVVWVFLWVLGSLPAWAQRPETLTVTLTGDSVLTQRLAVYDGPDYRKLVQLVREADVAFTNFEMLLHDYEPAPAPVSGGTYMAAPPRLARELVWMGFDLVSTANNHAFDYGPEGLLRTRKALVEAGLVPAGTGENLARARAPGYVETRHGRVALVAAASTFDPMAAAGEQRRDLRGRPGLSPLRYRTFYYVDAQSFAALQRLKQTLGMERWERSPAAPDRLSFLGQEFRLGEAARVETEPDPEDLAGLVRSVREARRQADWVLVSLHAHESAEQSDVPADFVVKSARALVDAGADIVVAHGPHLLRGVEIYHGHPIFYSLGNFIFQNETVAFLPAEMYRLYGLDPGATPADLYDARTRGDQVGFPADPVYWESVVAVVRFTGARLEEVRLYPIVLGHGKPRPQRGRPVLAQGRQADQILERLAALSKGFGTQMEIRDGVGWVKLPPD